MAAGTPAGTEITNRASATYIDPAGDEQTIPSNEITTTVLPVYRFEVLPNGTVSAPGQTRTALPGDEAVFTYTVTNLGNIVDTIALAPGQDTSDAYNLVDIKFYLDSNDNGIFDPASDTPVASLELFPDEPGTTIFAVGTVPPSAVPGTFANVNVTGTSADSGQTDTDNWARVITDTPAPVAGVDLGNSDDGDPTTDPSDAGTTNPTAPGVAVSFPLELKNTGNTPDTFDLTPPALPSGWTGQVFSDADCDGEADGAAVTAAGPLNPGETVCLVLVVTPTADAPAGDTDVTVTATSRNDGAVQDTITNTVTVEPVIAPVAGVNIGNGDENPATVPSNTPVTFTTPGTPVSYPLELTNTGDAADTFTLNVPALPTGWTAAV